MWLNKLIDAVEKFIGPSEATIEAALEKKATSHPELDWRHSIVDLMKLVGQDSSLHARESMARELGYHGPSHGEAAMNEFLHKKVLERLGVKSK
jgi:Domain of unknown function (DUF3597)